MRSKLDAPITLLVERPWQSPDALSVAELLDLPGVAEHLPADALEGGVELAPRSGWAMAVSVARGGAAGEEVVAAALAGCGAEAVQTASGWVTAALPDEASLARACALVDGAVWLAAAVGHGPWVSLSDGELPMPAGNLLRSLSAVAAGTPPGQVRWFRGAHGTSSGPPAGLVAYVPGDGGGDCLRPATAGAALAPPAPTARPAVPGDVVDGRFLLGACIGEGGFGVVHEATDTTNGRALVVKLLREERGVEREAVQRFFDEGRMISRLRSPHVVEVIDFGLAEDGRLFIAMERLRGRELAEILDATGALDPPRALRLVTFALEGLAEAHAQGLVHRDIKPGNLFVVDEGTPKERLRVIDFGIALDRTGEVRSQDRVGFVVGTPAYISPEQLRGESLDGRTDLYAIGLVLHACLAGGPPFEGDSPQETAYARLVTQPPSLATRALGPLPDGLAELVHALLEVSPALRPESAAVVAEHLKAIAARMGDARAWSAAWAHLTGPGASVDRGSSSDDRATRVDPTTPGAGRGGTV